MSEPPSDRVGDLIAELDRRLRESEQIRNQERERWQRAPFFPERRGPGHTAPDSDPHRSE